MNQSPGRVRWIICALLFFSVAVNYIDRLVIGILKKPLSAELGWTETDYGYIAAFFSFAYAFGYLIGGRAIDKLGVKKGLPIFVCLWSFAAVAHGLVSFIDKSAQFQMSYPWVKIILLFSENFPWISKFDIFFQWMILAMPMTAAGFLLARVALGLTEGANFPAAIKTVAEWFPVKERAFATGLFNAGTNVGAVLCPIAVPWMFSHIGWAWTFYITGATGFLWLIAWWFAYDEPEKHRWLSREELTYIRSGQPAVEEVPVKVPWLSLFRYRAVWAYVLASILAGPAWGFYQFFVPDFLQKRFNLTLQETGWWTGAFFGLAAIGGVAGGWLAGKLMGLKWSLNAARKTSLLICALAVVPVFFAPYAPTVLLAVLIVGLAGAAHQGWSANLFSVVSDTMPRDAISSTIGLGGFVAYFTGGFVNAGTGMVLQATGSYILVFAYFSGTYLLSLLAIQLLIPKIRDTANHTPQASGSGA
jgi:MFS transporter, ACS family, hexuronate transporter